MKLKVHSLKKRKTHLKSEGTIGRSVRDVSDRTFVSNGFSISLGHKSAAMSSAIASLSATLAIAGTLTLWETPATAFTITPEPNASALLDALLGDTTGLSNFQISATGEADAFGLFENDPFGLGSGIVLSTGQVADLAAINTEDGGISPKPNAPNDLSTDFGEEGATDDLISLEISFDADSTADRLFFQYIFGSEEFQEFGGSNFNDVFELWLNGVNLAYLTDGQAVTINNLLPNPRAGVYHPDYINNPSDSSIPTRLDGFTRRLTFEGLLAQNARNTLTIHIQDVGDGWFDSAVFIKGGSLGTQKPTDGEKIPEPSAAIALLAVNGMTLLKGRKRQSRG